MEAIVAVLSVLLGAGIIGLIAIFGFAVLILLGVKGLIKLFKWLFK